MPNSSSQSFDVRAERRIAAPKHSTEGTCIAGTADQLVVVTTDTSSWKVNIAVHDAEQTRRTISFPCSDDIQVTADGLFALRDASDDGDPSLRGYDLTTGATLPHLRALRGWPFVVSRGSPSRVAVADIHTKVLRVYRVADGEELFTVQGPTRGNFAPASASDVVAVLDEPGHVSIRGPDGARDLTRLERGFLLAWSADDSVLVAQGFLNEVVVWIAATGEEKARWGVPERTYLTDVSPEGRWVLTCAERSVSWWCTDDGTLAGRVEGVELIDAHFLDERTLAGVLRDGRAMVWRHRSSDAGYRET